MDTLKSSKDGWDKMQIVVTALSTIIIPVALMFATASVNKGLQDREAKAQAAAQNRELEAGKFADERVQRLQTFEIAVGILQQNPIDKEFKVLRTWAIETFLKFSGMKVTQEIRKELESKPLPKTVPASSLFGEAIFGETLFDGTAPTK